MGVNGLNWSWQSCIPFWEHRRELTFFPFLACGGHSYSLAYGPLSPSLKANKAWWRLSHAAAFWHFLLHHCLPLLLLSTRVITLCVWVAPSCPTLYNPMDCSLPWKSVHGNGHGNHSLSTEIFRQEYWCGLPFPSPGDFPDPRIKPRSPALQADSLLSEIPGEPSRYRITSASQSHLIINLLPSPTLIPLCQVTQHIHSFQGLGYGHLESGRKEVGRWALFYLAQPLILLISLPFLEKIIELQLLIYLIMLLQFLQFKNQTKGLLL